MGCFLSCFRARPDHSGGFHDPLVRESRLGDAFLVDDETELEANGKATQDLGNGGGVDKDLRREADYLKSCGTISETPSELLKSSDQIHAEDTNKAFTRYGSMSRRDAFRDLVKEDDLISCGAMSETTPEILELSNQIKAEDTNEGNNKSNSVQVTKGATVFEDKIAEGLSCNGHGTLRHDQSIDEGTGHIIGVESMPQQSSQGKSSCHNINIKNLKVDSSDSPYPTPLVLRGDMQTPGTFQTTYQGNLRSGKRGRTNKQFIYPVLRPIENKLQWTELRDDSSPLLSCNTPKRIHFSADSTEKPKQSFPSSITTKSDLSKIPPSAFHGNKTEQEEVASPEKAKNQNDYQQLLDGGEQLKNNSDYGKHGGASLSDWLKPSAADGESQSDTEVNMGKQESNHINVFTDRPIFVASGLNWDNDNPTPLMPKAWDGNGIPNTTTKYKEDQKVSWHATPFEERLMKVLSDEKPHNQRKISGKLIQLDENTE